MCMLGCEDRASAIGGGSKKENRVRDALHQEAIRAKLAKQKLIKKESKDNGSTDGTARCSVALVSWIAHALCQRFLVLAGRVRVADVHLQAGYLCSKKKMSKSRTIVIRLTYLRTRDFDFSRFRRNTKVCESMKRREEVCRRAQLCCPAKRDVSTLNLVSAFPLSPSPLSFLFLSFPLRKFSTSQREGGKRRFTDSDLTLLLDDKSPPPPPPPRSYVNVRDIATRAFNVRSPMHSYRFAGLLSARDARCKDFPYLS